MFLWSITTDRSRRYRIYYCGTSSSVEINQAPADKSKGEAHWDPKSSERVTVDAAKQRIKTLSSEEGFSASEVLDNTLSFCQDYEIPVPDLSGLWTGENPLSSRKVSVPKKGSNLSVRVLLSSHPKGHYGCQSCGAREQIR